MLRATARLRDVGLHFAGDGQRSTELIDLVAASAGRTSSTSPGTAR